MSRAGLQVGLRRGAVVLCVLGALSLYLILFNVDLPADLGPLFLLAPLLAITVAGFYVRSRILKVLCFVPAGWVIVEIVSAGL